MLTLLTGLSGSIVILLTWKSQVFRSLKLVMLSYLSVTVIYSIFLFTEWAGISRDITERKKMEDEIRHKNWALEESLERFKRMNAELERAKEKAEESDSLKSSFLANMSHEIRTPMNAIIGFSEMMMEPDLSDEKRNKYASIIIRRSHHLLSTVNDILDISMLESNSLIISKEPVEINKVLTGLFNRFIPMINKDQIEFQLYPGLEDHDSIILTDKYRLQQILGNLLDNAQKFTTVGSIKLGYELKDKYLVFFVSDTGTGIAKDQMNKIFERFYQVNRNLDSLHGGNGLGLTISKKLVELLGGEIWVESEKDKGSVINFTIPYRTLVS